MWRLLHALDMTPRDLASELRLRGVDVSTKELIVLLGKSRSRLPDIDRDAIWFAIEQYVNQQLGYLLASKHELNIALQKQRSHRALRMLSLSERDVVSPPSSLPRRQV